MDGKQITDDVLIIGTVRVHVYLEHYAANKRPSLRLSMEDGSPYIEATVNVPHQPIDKDRVYLRDTQFDQPINQALIDAGIVSEAVGHIEQGYLRLSLHELTI